jgi:hypothetical protein
MPFTSASGFPVSLCPVGLAGAYPPFNRPDHPATGGGGGYIVGSGWTIPITPSTMGEDVTAIPLSGSISSPDGVGTFQLSVDKKSINANSNRILNALQTALGTAVKPPVNSSLIAGLLSDTFVPGNSMLVLELYSSSVNSPTQYGYFPVTSVTIGKGNGQRSITEIHYGPALATQANSVPTSKFPAGSKPQWRLLPYNLLINQDNALFLPDQHPLQPAKDMLDGYYGFMDATTGQPTRVYLYNTSSFANLLADTTFGRFRLKVESQLSFNDFWKKNITNYGFGFRYTPTYISGSVIKNMFTPFDNRIPQVGNVSITITDADVLSLASVTALSGKPLRSITVNTKVEENVPIPGDGTAIPSSLINEADNSTQEVIAENLLVDGTDLSLDMPSIRIPDAVDPYQRFSGLPAPNGLSPAWNAVQEQATSDIHSVLNYIYSRFGGQGTLYSWDAKRTANTNNLQPGDWVFMNISVIPDLTNHVRNGTRLVQIAERSEDGLHLKFKAVDSGTNVVTPQPVISLFQDFDQPIFGLNTHTAYATIACAAGSRLTIDLAQVATSGSQPGFASPVWTHRKVIQNVPASTAVQYALPQIKGSCRYFVRAQAFGMNSLLPSVLDDTAKLHIDSPGIPPPTLLTYGGLDTIPFVAWNNNGTRSIRA